MSKKVQAVKLLEAIDESLRNKFHELRGKHFNPNTKGYEYEGALKDFLESYLGGVYDFHVRVPIIDFNLEVYSIFNTKKGENEFDVVSTYKTAVPKIILKAGATPFIPYDCVAFIVEVKQTLDSSALEKDLKKLDKLAKLKLGERFGVMIGGKFNVRRPLRILFYYESEIADATALKMLSNYGNAWDLMTVFMDDLVFANPQLPMIEVDRILISHRHPLLQLMFVTTVSLPYPPIVNAWSLFHNILRTQE